MKTEKKTGRVMALGFFDGVHLGHGTLLRRVADLAGARGLEASALTLDRHPTALLGVDPAPLLNSLEDRIYLIRRYYGIDNTLVLPFDEQLKRMPWERFLEDCLIGTYGAAHLVAGHDYRFGYQGQGTTVRLQEACAARGIGCDIIPAVEREGRTVSSTYIRTLVLAGEMERAAEFLGHPHLMSGKVERGKSLGHTIGFPTVNLRFAPGVLVPRHGGYITRVYLENGESYPAVTNVGVRPTVEQDGAVNVEGHLLNFKGDLYGQSLRMEFCRYLRPEQKFDSLEALQEEIRRNAEETAAYFKP